MRLPWLVKIEELKKEYPYSDKRVLAELIEWGNSEEKRVNEAISSNPLFNKMIK